MSSIRRYCLILTALVLASVTTRGASAKASYEVVTVKVAAAKVFLGQKTVATLKKGQKAYLTEIQGKWVGVQWEDANGNWQRGWVRATQITQAPAPKGKASK